MDKAILFVSTILVIPDPGFGDNNRSTTYINRVHGIAAGVTNGSFFHLPEVSVPLGLQPTLNMDVIEHCWSADVPKQTVLACVSYGLLPYRQPLLGGETPPGIHQRDNDRSHCRFWCCGVYSNCYNTFCNPYACVFRLSIASIT